MIINELIKLKEDINLREIPEYINPKKYSILFKNPYF